MNFNWNWKGLITAIVTAIMGWLSSAVVPVPGTNQPATVQRDR